MKIRTVLVAIALSVSSGANAQLIYIPPYNPGLALLNDSIKGDPNRNNRKVENERVPNEITPSTPVNFRYTPSTARTQQNLANFIASSRTSEPATAVQMERLFASQDVMGVMHGSMQQLGLSATNVADVFALYWVSAWQAANQQTADPSAATYRAVAGQAAQALAKSPDMAGATDAKKQEIAETLLIQVILIAAYVNSAKGDPSELDIVGRSMSLRAKKVGLDLESMKLTDQGFVAR